MPDYVCRVVCSLRLFSFSSISQASKLLYHPTTFRNNFKPKPKGLLKSHNNTQTKNYSPQSHKFTATPTCCNAKQPHLSPSKITSTYKNLPVGTQVHTAQTCYCWQNLSSRELPLAKPSQSVNRGRRLARSASRRPPVC